MKKYIEFITENFDDTDDTIKIYHSTDYKDDAEAILKYGYDVKKRRRARAEGQGMGAFFEPFAIRGNYGKYCIEFSISKEDFKKHIVIDNRPFLENQRSYDEICDFTKKLFGYNKPLSEQIKDIDYNVYKDEKIQKCIEEDKDIYDFMLYSYNSNILGYVTITRFNMLSIHLIDPKIAKAVRIITN